MLKSKRIQRDLDEIEQSTAACILNFRNLRSNFLLVESIFLKTAQKNCKSVHLF